MKKQRGPMMKKRRRQRPPKAILAHFASARSIATCSSSFLRVIRNRDGLYLKEDGAWTNEFRDAKRFEDVTSAFAAKFQFRIAKADMVLIMDAKPSKQYDVVLPL